MCFWISTRWAWRTVGDVPLSDGLGVECGLEGVMDWRGWSTSMGGRRVCGCPALATPHSILRGLKCLPRPHVFHGHPLTRKNPPTHDKSPPSAIKTSPSTLKGLSTHPGPSPPLARSQARNVHPGREWPAKKFSPICCWAISKPPSCNLHYVVKDVWNIVWCLSLWMWSIFVTVGLVNNNLFRSCLSMAPFPPKNTSQRSR